MFYIKVRENPKHTFYSQSFFLNHVIYDITWKNSVQPDTSQMTTWCMHIAYWIPTVTNTDAEYVTLIAFPLQQWLHEGSSVLHVHFPVWFILSPVPVEYLRRNQNYCLQNTGSASRT